MNEILQLLIDRLNTPIGQMLIVADRNGKLRAVDWTDHEPRMHALLRRQYGQNGFSLEPTCNPNNLTRSIGSYFEGDLSAINVLPVEIGGTAFQRKVWGALRRIPCGASQKARKSVTCHNVGEPLRNALLSNSGNAV